MITTSGAKKALAKRISSKPIEIHLDPSFPEQNAFVEDTSQFIDAQCSRRAGKTNGLALRFFKTMAKYPKSQCIYVALTAESAKEIMWPVLQELNDKYKLGCKFIESRLTAILPNGAKLRLYGADMKNFIKRLKGRKYPGIGIDEAQDFGSHLQSLIDDVFAPAISDYGDDGWLALTGTPGPVPHGFFFEVTKNRKYGFSHHEWTLLQNPYMPDPAKFIESIKLKREWDDENPTLRREYLNKWVLDVESLWVKYKENLNNYTQLPKSVKPYNYAVGIDIGFNDADAIAVLAWNDDSSNIYLVEEIINKKQGLTELVTSIERIRAKYDPEKLVIDEGGLGKKLAEEIRRRFGIPVIGADKARKQENVELLNDWLRLGKFKARAASKFAQDSYLIQIDWDKSTPNKIVIKKKPHSDIIDAVLYAFKESPAYLYAAPKEKPKPGTPEWYKQEEDAMFEGEMQKLQEEAEFNRRLHGID